jgi:hypothetical protein
MEVQEAFAAKARTAQLAIESSEAVKTRTQSLSLNLSNQLLG